ncbi:CRISPR-associated endonuclease Cas1 [Nitratifractor salsuginis]|uniref:CRISPR-associated endonuclease Cas1 n=1 Tax=Nitratifractor salsuginis (strain DSM 16511 / JCM 12458 / E9I37-1) TaxID=749222 RepID=E6WXQ7_NITSE|nr:CRISPR-associated endonuclease Cas1 [Nitratifractor salsuginis]ADV46314.1 CRISPR-associated protein, Cas1 family [Nitratifractor salsuginis DSM 16511]
MQKTDRTHFLMNNGRLRRQDNNLYFDRYDEEDEVTGTKILPVNAVDEIYILGKVDIDSYTMAFIADNNILLHFFSPYQSFRGNFFPNTSNSVNKSGFVLLQQLRAFDDAKHRLYIARQITRGQMLNGAANCKRYGVDFALGEHLAALERAGDIAQVMAAEGAFKKNYYQSWNSIIKNQRSFKFTARSKRPPTDKLNSFISYINTRIYNVTLSEIYKTELDPRIGFLHEPNYRSLSLHLDIAEIFKPVIGDNLIFTMLNKNEITAKDFKTDSGRIRFTNDAIKKIEMKMISKLTEQITIGKQQLTWRQMIRREVNQLKKTICEYSDYEPFVLS